MNTAFILYGKYFSVWKLITVPNIYKKILEHDIIIDSWVELSGCLCNK